MFPFGLILKFSITMHWKKILANKYFTVNYTFGSLDSMSNNFIDLLPQGTGHDRKISVLLSLIHHIRHWVHERDQTVSLAQIHKNSSD